MANPRIAIISDLWGFNNDPYVNLYVEKLYNHFDVDLIDAQVLSDVTSNEKEEEIHKQFIESGIDIATERLVKSGIHFDAILGFSVGGTIGWKAIQSGANIDTLYAISATRLRKETKPLKQNTKLFFGENEQFGPTKEWFEEMNIDYSIIPNSGHQLYKEVSFITEFCNDLIAQYSDKNECC